MLQLPVPEHSGQAARRQAGQGAAQEGGVDSDFSTLWTREIFLYSTYTGTQNRTGDRKWLRQIPVEATGTFRHVPRQNHVFGVRVPLPKNRIGATPRPELMGEPVPELVSENWLSLLDLVDERGFVQGLGPRAWGFMMELPVVRVSRFTFSCLGLIPE